MEPASLQQLRTFTRTMAIVAAIAEVLLLPMAILDSGATGPGVGPGMILGITLCGLLALGGLLADVAIGQSIRRQQAASEQTRLLQEQVELLKAAAEKTAQKKQIPT